MPRHRGKFDLQKDEPFELSRSKVESFIKCPACFWLEKVKGVKFPSTPGFNINLNTDKLLKRDMDKYRGKEPHPCFDSLGIGHLIPFAHEDLEKWTNSLHFGASEHYLNTLHKDTNIRFGGGLDDVFFNTDTDELHLIDFKSTSNQSKVPYTINLSGDWKKGYKRQMDMYVWLLRRKGFDVSNISYFFYVDGLHQGIEGMIYKNSKKYFLKNKALREQAFLGMMAFDITLLKYKVNTKWIENTLYAIKEILHSKNCPSHSEDCEYGVFLAQVGK